MIGIRSLAVAAAVVGHSGIALSEPVSLMRPSLFQAHSQSLIRQPETALISASPFVEAPKANSSLFMGTTGQSLFAPLPPHDKRPSTGTTQIRHLRDLIAHAEAGPMGYDAVQHGAKIGPPRPPTALTVQDVFAWIDATPGQPHAIGRYQVIPATLRRLVAVLDIAPSERFSPELQDLMADQLLQEAGLDAFLTGELPRRSFQNNLAKIWAGLPTSNGKSHYHGYAGNKATLTRAEFDLHFSRIFPS